ncbi:MAG: hypothetical protein FJ000_04770 [Actinobacteria bacterium]|nr:hypothetical protein [Actinomycetota bacterium]
MYDFYCETTPTMTRFIAGKVARFERGRFTTEDKTLADALLKKAEEWNLQPGDWAKPKARVKVVVGSEMAAPELPIPANPRGTKRKTDDDRL